MINLEAVGRYTASTALLRYRGSKPLDFHLITDEATGKKKLKEWTPGLAAGVTTAAIRTALSHVTNLINGVTKGYRYKMHFVVLSQRVPTVLPYVEEKCHIRQHLMHLIETYPSLQPKTAVFTHNDGRTVNLLQATAPSQWSAARCGSFMTMMVPGGSWKVLQRQRLVSLPTSQLFEQGDIYDGN
ncbi:ribosomal protein L6 family [Striga asiatica]|uniref:Ribosomal protein L6 family n=1 Tax=Striga asiatica TaxID=4170 RepID=A0A5A7RD38_STRAF|nr:ribosomal protein L6 family [Striga asiatica]